MEEWVNSECWDDGWLRAEETVHAYRRLCSLSKFLGTYSFTSLVEGGLILPFDASDEYPYDSVPHEVLVSHLLPLPPPHFQGTEVEATLAIIKPDGLEGNYTDAIKAAILRSGFKISREKIVQLDEESTTSFYTEHSNKRFFRSLVKYMTSGPVLIMVLDKENAVSDWRALIGPTDGSKAKITHPNSIRAMCGTDVEKNCVHGSDSPQSAQREISFFFDASTGRDDVAHDEL